MKYFILAFLFTANVFGSETFLIGGRPVVFTEKDGLLIFGCEKSCESIKIIQGGSKINLKKLRGSQKFHNSIGSDVCALAYKSKSLLGQASNRDQRAFCLFNDGSMVEINSLSRYLIQKGKVKE